MDMLSSLLFTVSHSLPYLAPYLLLYLVGVVVSLKYLKRFPTPAALALASCALLFVVTLVAPFIRWFIFQFPRNHVAAGNLIFVVAETLLRVTGFGLLLAAVFSGRSAPAESANNPGITTTGQVQDPSHPPHRATLVLVLGILSLIVCAPLGIAAWSMGGSDLTAMRSGRMDPSGESLTTVGRILGIIGTVLFCLGIVIACVWFVVAASFIPGG